VLALCAAEETGCEGAAQLAGALGEVGALLVGEPTNGAVAIAHKGVAWLRLRSAGVAAHASTLTRGRSAIEPLLDALVALRGLSLGAGPHPLLGEATVGVGTIAGGSATNVVPDRCEATLDVRLLPGMRPDDVAARVAAVVGDRAAVELELALPAVATPAGDPWVAELRALVADVEGKPVAPPLGMGYFSDASVLAPALGDPPVAIVGPGDPALAHKRDESCSVAAIERAAELYERAAAAWAGC
jgi:succinyl-diaminopimelate desuccinylase